MWNMQIRNREQKAIQSVLYKINLRKHIENKIQIFPYSIVKVLTKKGVIIIIYDIFL